MPLATLTTALVCALSARTVTLMDAEKAAESQRPDLRIARANVAAGEARTEQARAPALPQVKLDLEYQRTTGNRVQKPGRLRTIDNSWNTYNWYDAQLNAKQLLWDFGQTTNRWRAAEMRVAALGDTAEAALLQAMLAVRAAYFRARAQKELVAAARETLANQERHYQQISGFVTAGARPEIDLAQARVDRANARVQLIKTEDGYAVARAELNQAMGIAADTDYDVGDDSYPAVVGESGAAPPLIEEAIRVRPDLAALDAQIKAQDLTGRAARGGYWPTLSLTGGASDAGIQFTRTRTSDFLGNTVAYGGMAWNFYAGLELSWSIFQGFYTRGQVREADAALESLRAQRDALVQQTWVAVQQAVLGVRAAKEALVAADEALAGSRDRRRLAEGRYAAGVGSIIELGDAETAAANAAAQNVSANYALATARASLSLALGRR